MRRVLVTAVVCFWMAAGAVVQGIGGTNQPQEVLGVQDPAPAEWTLTVVPVPGPMPPGRFVVGSSIATTTPTTGTAPIVIRDKNTTLATYSFFFRHLNNLDREADRQAALGNEPAAKQWRTHEQVAAGLSSREEKLLKQVAYDCNQALEKRDAEIQAVVKAFRDEKPNGEFLKEPPPPELQALWQGRIQIMEQHIDQLRSLLGENRFQELDTYVSSTFVPGKASRVTAPVKGAAR